VSKSTENTLWGKVRTRALGNTDFTLKAAHAERTIDGYEVLPWLTTAENPLMRKYNMADRTRDTGGARADISAWQVVNIGLGVDYAKAEYTQSQIGLTGSKDVTYSADASAALAKDTSLHAYLTREKIDSQQAGSAILSTPTWNAQNTDTVDTVGVGVKHALIKGKLDIGVDYTVSYSRGEVAIQDGTAAPPFPDLISKLGVVKLHATYRLKDNLSLNGTWWYQHYLSENWQLNGISASTLADVLALGEQPPSFYANVVMLSVRYRF
ncbi:MAG: MtrB/PioB family outer membrane beta-barrel protein, partial [Gammaproteobacteria bacterium]|nr:MtrB/PioB family outer membrane beta-barrel protein [Gammaproteobacteria bacterium]